MVRISMYVHMKNMFLSLAVCFFILSYPHFVEAGTGAATEQLRPALDNLFSILSDPELQGDEHQTARREKIMGSIKGSFDFRMMSRGVLGKTWREISDEQQDQFTELMTQFLENVYIGRLEAYSIEKVIYTDERQKKENVVEVITEITTGGEQLPVRYFMYNNQGKWMVYDVYIVGFRLIKTYFDQFKDILRTEKFDGLVKIIEEKNRSLQENGSQEG